MLLMKLFDSIKWCSYYQITTLMLKTMRIQSSSHIKMTMSFRSFQVLPYKSRIKIRVNQAEDWPSYLYSIFPKEYQFVSIGNILSEAKYQTNDKEYFMFTFELDQVYYNIERRAYTFIDVLGQVGGFMGILIPLGSIIVGFISNKIYWMTLISTFYDTEDANNNSSLNSISPVRSNDSFQQTLTKPEIKRHRQFEEQKYTDEAIQNDDKSDF